MEVPVDFKGVGPFRKKSMEARPKFECVVGRSYDLVELGLCAGGSIVRSWSLGPGAMPGAGGWNNSHRRCSGEAHLQARPGSALICSSGAFRSGCQFGKQEAAG